MPALDQYFQAMVAQGASDLHLSSGNRPAFRISGTVTPIGKDVLTADAVKTLIYEIMPERNRVEWEQTHDTDFAYELAGVGRYRCNVYSDNKGIGGAFRLIPSKLLSFTDLGLPESVKKLCFLQKGLVLVTGPTGSGKSTTLAAIIDFINEHRTDHVITIEDPIEFVHTNKKCLINQREVHSHTDSFKRALRAALREDPDIVLVGEMRDVETVRIALETAETGHVVFGTLHTNSAHSTVDRLINQFPSDEQSQVRCGLADSLKGVVSQALLKRKGGKGRIAALEILMGSYALSANIREGKLQQIPNAIQMGRKEGMCSLNDSLLDLLAKDLVEPGEAYQKATAKEELLKRMGQLPNCRSPKGTPWTEDELIQAAAAEASAPPDKTAGNGNGSVPSRLPPPPTIRVGGIDEFEPTPLSAR
ncbi:MAG TPA: type IV pilus twitching motility protein PilT [Verrucomicrobiae bacterium]|nr:type IV pilus twitching motility protein PilT [Verrucomicrobiae bacterium]